MQAIDSSSAPGEAEKPAPTSSAPADILHSAGEFAGDSREFVSGLAATLRAEGQLNAELVKSVVLARIAEIVGWSLTWVLLLVFTGYTTVTVTGNIFVALATVTLLHLIALASLARLRRKRQRKIGFSRTRALVTGIEQ